MNDEEEILRGKIKNDLDSLSTFSEETKKEDSDKEKILQILLDSKDINLKTELSDSEILEISKLEFLSQRIKSVGLSSFLSTFKQLRVSKNRQGRKEIIGSMQDDDTKKNQGFFDQFVTDLIGDRKK